MADHGNDLRMCVRDSVAALLKSSNVDPGTKRFFQAGAQNADLTKRFAELFRGHKGDVRAILATLEGQLRQKKGDVYAWVLLQIAQCFAGKAQNDPAGTFNNTPIVWR